MNLVRITISFFLVALLAVTAAGWMWAGQQPVSKMLGARGALLLCALASAGCLAVLWRAGVMEPAGGVTDET